jgi:K(+)-stimulated pyrophosphate-energized sodium pump
MTEIESSIMKEDTKKVYVEFEVESDDLATAVVSVTEFQNGENKVEEYVISGTFNEVNAKVERLKKGASSIKVKSNRAELEEEFSVEVRK